MATDVTLRGRTVAVVGRAASIIGSGDGKRIDAADVVIRVNAMLPLEDGAPGDRGTRTDVLYHAKTARAEMEAAAKLGIYTKSVGAKLRHRLAWEADGFRPFTGTVAIFWALTQGAGEVYATGMDLYQRSGALGQPGGDLERGWGWKHAPAFDLRLLRRLSAHCPRFSACEPLAEQIRGAI